MKLEKIVPFGRSLDEYKSMFALSDSDSNKKIIGVGDGPASFNAEMFALGKSKEDQCYVGSAPGLILGGCHGDDVKQVFEETCLVVEDNHRVISGRRETFAARDLWP